MLFVTARLCVSFQRRFMSKLASLQQAKNIAFFSSNSIDPEENSVVFFRARNVGKRTAVVDTKRSYTYDCLLQMSDIIGEDILKGTRKTDLSGCCISFLCPNNVLYVATQWAIWRNGGIAVPLCSSHPDHMLRYVIEDCGANMVVSSREYSTQVESLAKETGVEFIVVDEATMDQVGVHEVRTGSKLTAIEGTEYNWDKRDAMIIYTSGTTGLPKGVLSTHGNLRSQVSSLVEAWGWTENDYIIHCLPLHHVHGVVNVLMCALWVGATCHMLPKFSPQKVWDILTGKNPQPSLFMAVPTIYSKLIQHFNESNYNEVEKDTIRKKCQELRLMVSGSSALPEPVMKRWHEITGHTLLERYGMTEIGMALSNPLNGSRLPGCVGIPLPGTEVRIVAQNEDGTSEVLVKGNEHGSEVASDQEGKEGELQVRGPSVFKCYWNKSEATSESFTKDGWFKTGDTAAYKDGVYSILGRTSVDIIKSGGYKISALDVERHLLSHDYIVDCAVVGKPDPVWGERVAAIVAVHQGKTLSLEDLRHWARGHMAPYQTPSVLLVVDDLPRNTMGKVNKKELLKLYLNKL